MKAAVVCVLLAAATAHAVTNEFGVVFCHATVANASDGEACLALTIPSTSGFFDTNGNPVAVWNVGGVVSGGTADTFRSENGPGAFQARNVGNRAAFVYVTSGLPSRMAEVVDGPDGEFYEQSLRDLFGDSGLYECSADFDGRFRWTDDWEYGHSYRLAVSTKVDAKFPDWRNLEWLFMEGEYTDREGNGLDELSPWNEEAYMGWVHVPDISALSFQEFYSWAAPGGVGICGQYLGFLLPGEEIPFDLKFWAPLECEQSVAFIVRLEASTFRRWRHGK